MLENYQKLLDEPEFQQALISKQLCLFLGSGVAFNLGMPDWLGLAEIIVKFCFEKQIITRSEKLNLLKSTYPPIKIISICIDKIEKLEFIEDFEEKLKETFYTKPKKRLSKNKIYTALKELYKNKKVLILQTNYDVMLEKYLNEQESINRGYYIPYSQKGSIDYKNDKYLNNIIYLHGRLSGEEKELERPIYKSLVLDRKSYNKVYVLENEEYCQNQKKFLQYILKNFYIIFLGYSLSDSELLQIIANKPKTERYKRISVIVDNCKAKEIENEFNSNYLSIASNGKIKTYTYDTEHVGI